MLRTKMAVRQLAERNGDGIIVELFWNDSAPAGADVYIEYRDERQDVCYTLYPTAEAALDAFYHPNAYIREERQRASRRAAA
jgi:hypothetical protein